MLLTPTEAIAHVSQPLAGFPACIAGSAVAAETYGLPLGDKADVDVFCYSDLALVAATQRLIDSGFQLEDRFARVWERWLRYGFRNWHTNSIKFRDPSGLEVNLVYKLLGKNPVNSLAQVIESFDFGLLAVGYDLLTGNKHDMRSYLFPTYDIDGPLPMMSNKRGSMPAASHSPRARSRTLVSRPVPRLKIPVARFRSTRPAASARSGANTKSGANTSPATTSVASVTLEVTAIEVSVVE